MLNINELTLEHIVIFAMMISNSILQLFIIRELNRLSQAVDRLENRFFTSHN